MMRYLERVKNSYNLNSLDLRLGRMLRLIVQTCRNVSSQLRLQRLLKDGSSESYGEGGLGELSSCTNLFVKIFHTGLFSPNSLSPFVFFWEIVRKVNAGIRFSEQLPVHKC